MEAIQVDARACKVDIPEMSMSTMEDKFDQEALTTASYIVTLPSEAKQIILDEGSCTFQATIKRKYGSWCTTRPRTETLYSQRLRPRLKQQGQLSIHKKRERRADIICIYRMERQQLGRLLKAATL